MSRKKPERRQEVLVAIENSASRAFGKNFARQWMQRPSRFFNGRTPVQMASSETGGREVLQFVRYLTAVEDQDTQARG